MNVCSTNEFTLFLRVKPGRGPALREALRRLHNTPGYKPGDYKMAITTIHEARFVPYDDDTRLLFATSFDARGEEFVFDCVFSEPVSRDAATGIQQEGICTTPVAETV